MSQTSSAKSQEEEVAQPVPGVEYEIRLGKTFRDHKTKSSKSYHCLAYNFKPASVDEQRKGVVQYAAGEKIVAEWENKLRPGEVVILEGHYVQCKEGECVLIFDGQTFWLEQQAGVGRGMKVMREVQTRISHIPQSKGSKAKRGRAEGDGQQKRKRKKGPKQKEKKSDRKKARTTRGQSEGNPAKEVNEMSASDSESDKTLASLIESSIEHKDADAMRNGLGASEEGEREGEEIIEDFYSDDEAEKRAAPPDLLANISTGIDLVANAVAPSAEAPPQTQPPVQASTARTASKKAPAKAKSVLSDSSGSDTESSESSDSESYSESEGLFSEAESESSRSSSDNENGN